MKLCTATMVVAMVARALVAAPQDALAIGDDPTVNFADPTIEFDAENDGRQSRGSPPDIPDEPLSPPPAPSTRQSSLRQFEFLTKTGEFYAGFFLCILSYVPAVGCPLFTGSLDSVESAASAEGVRVASAVFEGHVNGLVYFLQKKLDTVPQETTVMARVNGAPPGLYLIQLRERGHIGANCSRVGGLFQPVEGPRAGVLGTLSVDEYSAGLAVLTQRTVPMLGDDSVLGRSVVIVPRPEEGQNERHPIACAVIARF